MSNNDHLKYKNSLQKYKTKAKLNVDQQLRHFESEVVTWMT